MIRRITGRLHRALVLVMVLSLVLPYVAFGADLVSDASLSSQNAAPSQVGTGSNTFTIKVWANGTIASDKNGVAKVAKKYSMATNGAVTASTAEADQQSLSFTVDKNYTPGKNCPEDTATNQGTGMQGCKTNPFSVSATLEVAASTPTDTQGTLVVDLTGSNGLEVKSGSEDTAYVQVATQATSVGSITASSSTYGGTTVLSAKVSPTGAPGSVAFYVNGSSTAATGTVSYDSSTGVATLSNYSHGLNASTMAYSVKAVFTSSSASYSNSNETNSSALTVNKAPVTITPDSGQSKVYGEADPTLTFSNSGSLASSSFTGALARATGESVGSYAIKLGTLSAGSNYELSLSATTVNFTITARPITVTADAQSKTYGEADPTLTYRITSGSLVGTDSFSGSLSRAAGESVGTYAIQKNTLSAGTNYNLTYVEANLTIGRKTVTGSFSAANKTYDGTTDARITGRSLTDVLAGDDVSLSDGTASFADKNAGIGKTVSGTGFTLSGTAAGNYSLASSSLSTTANITPKALTGSFTASNKTYDGTRAATVAGTSLPGVIQGDAVSLEVANTLFDTKNVGTGKDVTGDLSLSGTGAGNYTVNASHTAKANITAKAIRANFTADNKTYDGSTGATITGSSLVTSDIVSNDDVSLNRVGASASFADKNVGTGKTVTGTGFVLTGTDAGNYSLSMNTTTADITAKNLTVSGAAANDKIYNGNAAASVNFSGASLSGVVEGDTVTIDSSSYSASFADKNVGTDKAVTVTGVALGGTGAGNYTVSQPSGLTADITAKAITGNFTADNKVYDGNTSATVLTRSLTDEVAGDAVSLSGGTATFNTKDVGTGKAVTLTGTSLSGADAGNYSLSGVNTTTASITPRSITVTADNKVKVLGAADPALTYQVTGSLVEGDSFSGSLERAAGESVGSYPISQGTLSAGGNYNVTFVGGTLSIQYAPASASCLGAPGRTILQPINVDGTSVFKLGSTVPAKFRVCDANGNSIGTAGVVTSFKMIAKTSATGTLAVNEEVLSTNGDTAFRWDATNQQWIYNISTKNSAYATNTKYTYRVTLNDNTSFDFSFSTK